VDNQTGGAGHDKDRIGVPGYAQTHTPDRRGRAHAGAGL